MLRICSLFALVVFAAVPALAGNTISGFARVIDGDTLDLAGERVRLYGIDTPEIGQNCERRTGDGWDCGDWAKRALASLIGDQELRCEALDRDRYGRIVARCHAGGADIGRTLVQGGVAYAFTRYSTDYVAEETDARDAARGLWAGTAMRPWDYRAATAEAMAPEGCAIKGNISGQGRLYHLPGSRWYAKVQISARKGERWFCSADEAQAAGWRAAQG